jgi:hypothetical protein
MTRIDVAPKHPEIVSILEDLASALLPRTTRYGLVFDADAHEYFGKCITDGFTGSFDESKMSAACRPEYLEYIVVKNVVLPSYIADTPDILGSYVARELCCDSLQA